MKFDEMIDSLREKEKEKEKILDSNKIIELIKNENVSQALLKMIDNLLVFIKKMNYLKILSFNINKTIYNKTIISIKYSNSKMKEIILSIEEKKIIANE